MERLKETIHFEDKSGTCHTCVDIGRQQEQKRIIEIIDKMAKKVKPVQVDIGEYDKFISCLDLKQQIQEEKKQ